MHNALLPLPDGLSGFGQAPCLRKSRLPETADEVALAILFLIKNDFVTGTTVDVDGGWLLS